jgi:CheY-like chemotaxis protein
MASKVLLVEDDNNLREIYQARLQAEGYDIVSAKDGEEALVIAKKEQPDLIISDVMMPRVSGFEMLDILRNTEGLKDPKVIMLTALGQADDKTRADQLGDDRYLVKSQVTLEDIVKAAQDLLSGSPAPAALPAPSTEAPAEATPPVVPVVTAPIDPIPAVTPSAPVDTPVVNPVPPVEPPAVPAPEPESIPVEPPAAPSPDPEPAHEPVEPVVEAPIGPDATPAPTVPGTEPVVTEPIEAGPDDPSDPNDQLMADALKDLTSATSKPADTAPTVDPPLPSTSAVDPEPVDQPVVAAPESEPTTTSSNDPAGGDSSPVAHKKIIRPLPPEPTAAAKPNLDELLAREETTSTNEATPTPPVPAAAPTLPPAPVHDEHEHITQPPHPPGHVISPSPAAPSEATAGSSGVPPAPPEAPAQTLPTPDGQVDPNSIAL